ncbi:MAG: hypothetical protein ACI4WH_07810, partial [Oscillospiraceae bacterium]
PLTTESVVTEAPADTTINFIPVTDIYGNVYNSLDYFIDPAGFAYAKGSTGSETAQNYAAAVEAYYGIPMNVYGNAVEPACFSDWDLIWDDLDSLNAWRQGRSPAEIGPQEIVANWKLLGSDIEFLAECQNYLANDLGLQFSFGEG